MPTDAMRTQLRSPAGRTGAAGAAGVAAAGASAMAAGQGGQPGQRGRYAGDPETEMLPLAYESSYAPEPELLTHRDDELELALAGDPDFLDRDDDDADDEDREPTEEDRIARKKKIWRRVRRTGYALVAFFIIAPIVGFIIMYQFVDVPQPSDIAAAQKKPVTYFYANKKVMDKDIAAGANRELIDAGDMPETVKHAAYAAEDATFETNSGFDITGILRAAWSQVTGGAGGGSTITQQYVKQATGNDQHSYIRKATELVKAYKMNKQQGKQEIIAAYLNTVYFGRSAYGIQAAAQEFFKKDARQLTKPQAAFLAGIIQSPGRSEDEEYTTRRWNFVMDQMVQHNWISKAERDAASIPKRVPYVSGGGVSLNGREYLGFIERQIKKELAAAGLDGDQLQRNGAKIYTTLNPYAQQQAVKATREVMTVDRKRDPHLGSALVSADPRTGEILAYYGGADPQKYDYDMADTPHTPGSSFKPFVFLAALRNDPSVGIDSVYDGSDDQVIGGVRVRNADEESCAQCTVRDAMTQSINTVFYKMAFDTGTRKVRQAALDAGISQKVKAPGSSKMVDSLGTVDESGTLRQVDAGIALGQYEVTPKDMAQGYATLANRGERVPLHFVSKVTDQSGEQVLYSADQPPQPAFDKTNSQRNEDLAGNVTESMLNVAAHSEASLEDGRQVASKTGTAQFGDTGHNQAAWMVGFTPQVVTSVWVGKRDTPGAIYGYYKNTKGSPTHYDIYGREEPSYIWQMYMSAVLANQQVMPFPNAPTLGGNENKSGKPIVTEDPVTTTTEPDPSDTEKPSKSSKPEKPTEPSDPGNGGGGGGGDNGPGGGGGGPGGGGDDGGLIPGGNDNPGRRPD